MKVIEVRNVSQALPLGLDYLMTEGTRQPSRNGEVWVSPVPVTTVYQRPWERVLTNPIRDANPFFHLVEAVWMLAGRDDAAALTPYVRRFSEYAEPDGRIHGAYGARWRRHFSDPGQAGTYLDQLAEVIGKLKVNPLDRQAVIAMWSPEDDLLGSWRDRPCNTHVYLRVRDGSLDLCVMCRSNDIVWGAYGANAVHFSVLQEYIAGALGIALGTMTQVSWNYHAYVEPVNRMLAGHNIAVLKRSAEVYGRDIRRVYPADLRPYIDPVWAELTLLRDISLEALVVATERPLIGPQLLRTVQRAARAHCFYRLGDHKNAAIQALQIEADDWLIACAEWLNRRAPK